MAREFSKLFYKSEAWKHARMMALGRDSYLCQDCLANGLIKEAEEVHHIVELTPDNINDPSIATDIHNLVSLCHDCHMKRHILSERRYRISKDGELLF